MISQGRKAWLKADPKPIRCTVLESNVTPFGESGPYYRIEVEGKTIEAKYDEVYLECSAKGCKLPVERWHRESSGLCEDHWQERQANRCEYMVGRTVGNHTMFGRCENLAKIERDGKRYCKIHDPVYVKEKQRKWREDFDREWTEKQERWAKADEKKERTDRMIGLLSELYEIGALEQLVDQAGPNWKGIAVEMVELVQAHRSAECTNVPKNDPKE